MSVNKRCFILLTILFSTIFSIIAIAQPTNLPKINTQIMAEQLNIISQSVLSNTNDYEGLSQTISEINALQHQINGCIESGKTQLNKINPLLREFELSKDAGSYNYLFKEKNNKLTQVTSCQFINYRLEEIRDIAIDQINHINKAKLGKKIPFWNQFNANLFFNVKLSLNAIYQKSGIDLLNSMYIPRLALAFLLGLILALILIKISSRYVDPAINITKRYIIYILPLGLVCLYMNNIFAHTTPTPIIIQLINAVAIYTITLYIIGLCLRPGMKKNPWPKAMLIFQGTVLMSCILYIFTIQFSLFNSITIPLKFFDLSYAIWFAVLIRLSIAFITDRKPWLTTNLAVTIQRRAFIIATVTLLCYIVSTILSTQALPPFFLTLLDTLYITLLNLAYFFLIKVFIHHIMTERYRKPADIILKACCFLSIIAAWFGYHYLAIMLIPNLIITAVIIVIILDVIRFNKNIYILLNDPNQPTSKKLRYILGVKSEKNLVELLIFRVFFTLPVIALGIVSIFEIWGATRYQISNILITIHDGVPLLGATLRPALVVRAACFFCIIVLMGRALATYIVRNKLVDEEKHSKMMATSLIHYMSFTIGLLIALYIAGLNLRGIVVIAGALSVGLGFGLQNFAKDLISGLLIMFNKPIKIGDHIVVGDHLINEGFVKKIGAFSTQLHTMSHSDLIIPNSEIITKIITNFTFRNNKLARIKITVTLDKNSDFDVSMKRLLNIAANNPGVVQDPPYQPVVLFELDDLNLWCVINDVNKKELILSDLNFAIANAFKGNL